MPPDVRFYELKCTKFDFHGLHPRSHWGAYSALPDPLAVFKGPTSKGGWERGGVKGRGREVDFV